MFLSHTAYGDGWLVAHRTTTPSSLSYCTRNRSNKKECVLGPDRVHTQRDKTALREPTAQTIDIALEKKQLCFPRDINVHLEAYILF